MDQEKIQSWPTEQQEERALLVGLPEQGPGVITEEAETLSELADLVRAAGAVVVGSVVQRQTRPDSAFRIGKGKIEELRQLCLSQDANLIVFDDELTGTQIRNLEEVTQCKVIDRTFLILDIFSRRAQTHEGKLQVELAQQQYRLSRLVGLGQALSRLGGGIGTRGPGETKLESDRRHINRRIHYLRRALKQVSNQRAQLRKKRQANQALTLAVVGYTNSGKSTLINRLSQSQLLTADQVFATLDPSVRKWGLPDETEVLLIDTVGFIRKLPHHLVDAFRATLEEITQADAILEVIDASEPYLDSRMSVVDQLIDSLGASKLPRFYLLNKVDLLDDLRRKEVEADLAAQLVKQKQTSDRSRQFWISAVTGEGLDHFAQAMVHFSTGRMLPVDLELPYRETARIETLRRFGRIDTIDYLPEHIQLSGYIQYSHYHLLQPFSKLAKKSEER